MWIVHSLFDPDTTPANGEVSASAVSSSVRCSVLSCLAPRRPIHRGRARTLSVTSFC